MPSEKLLEGNNKYIKAWKRFIDEDEIDNGILRKKIVDSWVRSKSYKVDPYENTVEVELGAEELNERSQAFKPILDIALPFMETIYKAVGESGMVVRFTDSDGYVLECFGDEFLMNQNLELHLYKGTNVSEEQIGTNAIGIALRKGIALQVLGAEHYRKDYHKWTTSAAPIKNDDGQIIGVLSMSGNYKRVHPHTLGMILASALAIEHEIKLNKSNDDLTRVNKHLDAIMQSISEGIMTITYDGVITDVNYFAKKILKKSYKDIIGKTLDEIASKSVLESIKKEMTNSEEKEIQIISNGRKKTILISFKPIYSHDSSIKEYLITFRESKKVYSQANKLFGANAIYTFDDILGTSMEIFEAIRLAKLVAATDATILLHGESGTGKEMFAQGIHNESPRKNNSFVFINCGAIPRDLVASELFGYEEGAFTGARKGGNPGKFELAEGGTLFLDEIGDMPLDTQSNLLRVLETKEVVRVGGNEVIPVDVRVIAASHKDLSEEVEKGNFRSDLFYRLNVMPIHTPSLRERRNDIKSLVDFFYIQFKKSEDKKVNIDESFYTLMKQYDWPGNVRELQNVMQMVTNIIAEDEKLSCEHIPSYMKDKVTDSEIKEKIDTDVEAFVRPLYIVEKEAILNALKASHGNLAQAAKMLEIGRSTLYRKIEKYNIDV